MKLIFKKDADQNLGVFVREGTVDESFSYVKMVKALLQRNEFEESEFDPSLTEQEKMVINSMLKQINQVVSEGRAAAEGITPS